jgi:hypothetical protein
MFAVILLLPRTGILRGYRSAHQEWAAADGAFSQALKGIDAPRALVFVVEEMKSHPERSAVQNVVDLNRSPVVLAHDQGARDSLLIRALPGRAAYIVREKSANGAARFQLERIGQGTQPGFH